MRSFVGSSQERQAERAVAELTQAWPSESPDLVLAFSSTEQDPDSVRRALRQRYPQSLVVGCTTSGENAGGQHYRSSVSAAALYTPKVRWAAHMLAPLSSFTLEDARTAVETLYETLQVDSTTLDPREMVAILLCDGLSRKEEAVAAAVADKLEGVPLVGGSAGDDLKFKSTQVTISDCTRSDAAVLLLARGPVDFYQILKHQHFTSKRVGLAVTRAEPELRRVYELDGYPAAEAYARALGVDLAELSEATFLNPVSITVQGQPYIRSVQAVHEDGSMTFYCAVEEGWVLDISDHGDMTQALATELKQLANRDQRPPFLLLFNCILRALEAEKSGVHCALKTALHDVSDEVLGFDTYGEVFNGLHINQTLVALALRAS